LLAIYEDNIAPSSPFIAVVAVVIGLCWRMAPVAACGQIGCNCGAFAPYFLGFPLFFARLTPGVEGAETAFKGVQITLGLADF
jgi:hypothetical protein